MLIYAKRHLQTRIAVKNLAYPVINVVAPSGERKILKRQDSKLAVAPSDD